MGWSLRFAKVSFPAASRPNACTDVVCLRFRRTKTALSSAPRISSDAVAIVVREMGGGSNDVYLGANFKELGIVVSDVFDFGRAIERECHKLKLPQ